MIRGDPRKSEGQTAHMRAGKKGSSILSRHFLRYFRALFLRCPLVHKKCCTIAVWHDRFVSRPTLHMSLCVCIIVFFYLFLHSEKRQELLPRFLMMPWPSCLFFTRGNLGNVSTVSPLLFLSPSRENGTSPEFRLVPLRSGRRVTRHNIWWSFLPLPPYSKFHKRERERVP